MPGTLCPLVYRGLSVARFRRSCAISTALPPLRGEQNSRQSSKRSRVERFILERHNCVPPRFPLNEKPSQVIPSPDLAPSQPTLLTVWLCARMWLLGVAALVLATATGVLAGFLLGIAALAVWLAAALHRAAGFAVFTTVPALTAGCRESRRGKRGKAGCHEKEGRTFH